MATKANPGKSALRPRQRTGDIGMTDAFLIADTTDLSVYADFLDDRGRTQEANAARWLLAKGKWPSFGDFWQRTNERRWGFWGGYVVMGLEANDDLPLSVDDWYWFASPSEAMRWAITEMASILHPVPQGAI